MAGKYQQLADRLASEICRGALPDGQRLPAESALAERYQVSRATVRNALATLKERGLVETVNGAGSFVTYDGHRISELTGWTAALAGTGVDGPVELISFGKVHLPALAAQLTLTDTIFLWTERVRSAGGKPVSLERSHIPWQPAFDDDVNAGPLTGSLQQLMVRHGLIAASYDEAISVAHIGYAEAGLLHRAVGTAFLLVDRTARNRAGDCVEHVVSLLDPEHFAIQRTVKQR